MPEDTPHSEPPSPEATPTRVAAIYLPEISPTQEPPSQPAAAIRSVPAAAPSPELPLFQSRAVAPVATGGPMLSSAQALLRRDLWTKNNDGKPVYRPRRAGCRPGPATIWLSGASHAAH